MVIILALCLSPISACAAPGVATEGSAYVVSGTGYRVRFVPEAVGLDLEMKGADGRWHLVGAKPGAASFALFADGQEHGSRGARATWAAQSDGDAVRVAQQSIIDPLQGTVMELNFICVDEGVLMSAHLIPTPQGGIVWCPPRIALPPEQWDGYLFWDQTGRRHEGKMSELGQEPTYAGVSAWGPSGDTVAALDPTHPALISHSGSLGIGLGAVYVDLADRWKDARMFIQRHTPVALYLYAGYAPASEAMRWAWLAPIAAGEEEAQVERLVQAGRALAAGFEPIAKAVPDAWKQPVPDFPANLRRAEPVRDINDAAVYSINEHTSSDYGVSLARKVGSDVLIRGWFKWAEAPPVNQWRDIPARIHEQGALFGGGITCSALYDGENGLTEAEWKDMATRGPAGQLVDAWDTPGIRHGTLSNPAYLDYLFRWCKEQIDAGVDYLFMDEIGAALSEIEGFDDYSLADFRRYLLESAPQTEGFAPDDARWADLGIDLTDPAVCPDGTMRSFDYRAYMRAKGVLERPTTDANPLSALWWQFRRFRDDHAWKTLTDRLCAYAAEHGWTLYISANGLARYVDLQVLGVWGDFSAKGGHIDLSENQIPVWRSTVMRGRELAGKRVPVVFFHDWGFGDPPFPFLALPPSEREIWGRVRGAEIYAAGGFYAFPVLGPFGCDAGRDGTLREIARQTRFYQANRDLYLRAEYVGSELLGTEAPNLSLAVSWLAADNTLLLHVINREMRDGALDLRENVAVEVPVSDTPVTAVAISPDWQGEQEARFEKHGAALRVTLPRLEAYAVVKLAYSRPVDLANVRDPARIVPSRMWSRPVRGEFIVRPDCYVENGGDLNGFLQGRLHTNLRNPPTFLANATAAGRLLVMVQAVSVGGARVEYSVDGVLKESVDLPDLDGKNDGQAAEYNRLLTFDIPAGRHRLTLDNTGGDWCTISWLQFEGKFDEW